MKKYTLLIALLLLLPFVLGAGDKDTIDLNKQDYVVTLGLSDALEFNYMNATHVVVLDKISVEKKSAYLKVFPYEKEYAPTQVKFGLHAKVDLNLDKVYDLKIDLLELYEQGATISLTKISESGFSGEQAQPVDKITSKTTLDQLSEIDIKTKIISAFLLAIIVLCIVLYFVKKK